MNRCRVERGAEAVVTGPSTYSIVGADVQAKECGVAVQSKFLSVGAFVPWAQGGVGAVATQAMADVMFGPRGLMLLESRLEPEVVITELLAGDAMADHRQIGLVSSDGRAASYTGSRCFEFAASRAGDGFAAQGNILTSVDVVNAMAETFLATEGALATRLLTALAAGQTAGGEKRGMESSALLVVKPGAGYGGNHDRWMDLRVDHADDPIAELGDLLDLHKLYFGKSDAEDVLVFGETLRQEIDATFKAIGWSESGTDLEESLFSWLGWHNLEERWLGMEELDPLVLRELRKARKETT